jgi:hypothetical protein
VCNCPSCAALPTSAVDPHRHIDPATGIAPIHEWGSACARGFVSDARFSRGSDLVIKRADRTKTRQVYRAMAAQVGGNQ